jgi:hypothetical protein
LPTTRPVPLASVEKSTVKTIASTPRASFHRARHVGRAGGLASLDMGSADDGRLKNTGGRVG